MGREEGVWSVGWRWPRGLSFWGHCPWEFPGAQRAAYLVSNCCWLPTQDAWLQGYPHSLPGLPATPALSLECPNAERQGQTGRVLSPASQLLPGLCRGRLVICPSELSYVSFLLGWGRGVNQLPGAVRPGQLLFLQLRPGMG